MVPMSVPVWLAMGVLVFRPAPRVGGGVGWDPGGARTWTFALNLDVTKPEHLAARSTIARAILRDLGAPA